MSTVSTAALAASPETRATDPARLVTFTLRADADPGVLPRVLELVAKRGLVPELLTSRRHPDSDTLSIEMEVSGMVRHESDHVANCLRAIPMVMQVLATERTLA